MKTLLRAAFVAPIDRPLLRDAAVVFDAGTILAVGPAADLRRDHPDAAVTELPDHVLLPGLVNPHTHLELSNCSCWPASASFTDWIKSLPGRLGRDRGLTPEEIFPATIRAGVEQCLRFGVTCVGDISQQMHLTRPLLAAGPLRSVTFGEVLGLGRLRPRYDELFPRAIDRAAESAWLRVGVSPHAPYTVDLPGFRQCLDAARRLGLPLATHLAEHPGEQDFLERHAGPFRELWESLGLWSEPVETFAASPVRFAHDVGLLDYPTLLGHVNYCSDDELALLADGRASVVYCPRTHAYFGHPPHRFRDMLAAGVNVAIGTDSCASSPDLNLLDDLRLVHRLAPEMPAESLFPLVTINAAGALQMDRMIGSLTAGKAADLVAFTVRTETPLLELLESDMLPTHLWIAGQAVSVAAATPGSGRS